MVSHDGQRVIALRAGIVLALLSGVPGAARAQQAHMEAALTALQNAASELRLAEHDKAGHRGKALNLVESAIRQVEMGMAAGAR